jgi:hypothetical protein
MVVVVVVVVVASVHGAGAAGRCILFAVLGLPILGTGREVAWNLFDAVFACGAVDEILDWPSSAAAAALNVRRLGDILGLPRAVPTRNVVAVLGHGGASPALFLGSGVVQSGSAGRGL